MVHLGVIGHNVGAAGGSSAAAAAAGCRCTSRFAAGCPTAACCRQPRPCWPGNRPTCCRSQPRGGLCGLRRLAHAGGGKTEARAGKAQCCHANSVFPLLFFLFPFFFLCRLWFDCWRARPPWPLSDFHSLDVPYPGMAVRARMALRRPVGTASETSKASKGAVAVHRRSILDIDGQ